MKKLRNDLPVTLGLMFGILFFAAFGCYGQTPLSVVEDFTNILAKKDKEKLVRFVMNAPAEVSKRAALENPNSFANPAQQLYPADPSGLKGQELVEKVVPAAFFDEKVEWRPEIKETRVAGNEAVVRVNYKAVENSEIDDIPTLFDFLLYKGTQGWQIFAIHYRLVKDDSTYTYKFYANPK